VTPGDSVSNPARGAAAGAAAAALWAAQQPLDKRVLESDYDDVELLGRLVTSGDGWRAAGLAMHVANGAVFGAAYSLIRPAIPGPGWAAGALVALAENFAFWPLVAVTDRFHPARRELPRLGGNRPALAQATWRHLVFGVVLGALAEPRGAAGRSRRDNPCGEPEGGQPPGPRS
jgi:hypothetical protein